MLPEDLLENFCYFFDLCLVTRIDDICVYLLYIILHIFNLLKKNREVFSFFFSLPNKNQKQD